MQVVRLSDGEGHIFVRKHLFATVILEILYMSLRNHRCPDAFVLRRLVLKLVPRAVWSVGIQENIAYPLANASVDGDYRSISLASGPQQWLLD